MRLQLIWAVLLSVLVSGRVQAQSDLPVTPCALEKGVYNCSWPAFTRTLKAAQTVAVQTEPMDVRADTELAKMAVRLKKTVVTVEDAPELTFLLVPLNNKGIFIGDNEQDIATLRVYVGRTRSRPGQLVWAETYRGAEDIPWPSVVYYTILQFEGHVKRR